MADDIESLKHWKEYYKKRYEKTSRKIYKEKFKDVDSFLNYLGNGKDEL